MGGWVLFSLEVGLDYLAVCVLIFFVIPCRMFFFLCMVYLYWQIDGCFQALGPGFTEYAELVFVRCINLIHTHEVAKVFLSLKLPFQSTVSAFLIVFMETPVVFKCSLIWLIC
jgi:hypothetical protein